MISPEKTVILSHHLQDIHHLIDYKYGRVQNKEYERKLPKLFEYETFDDLNEGINNNISRQLIPDNEEIKKYYQHRWFVYMCSLVDNFLFKNKVKEIYPNNKFLNSLDLRGIVILEIEDIYPDYLFKIPLAYIDVLYKQQMNDFRYRKKFFNRLFILPYSYVDTTNEMILRTAFEEKSFIFEEYIKLHTNHESKLYDYFYRKTDIICLVEREAGVYEYGFGSENPKDPIKFHLID